MSLSLADRRLPLGCCAVLMDGCRKIDVQSNRTNRHLASGSSKYGIPRKAMVSLFLLAYHPLPGLI